MVGERRVRVFGVYGLFCEFTPSFVATEEPVSVCPCRSEWWMPTRRLAVIAHVVTNGYISPIVEPQPVAEGKPEFAKRSNFLCFSLLFLISSPRRPVKAFRLPSYTLMPLPCPRLWLMAAIQPEKFPWVGASWLMQRRGEKKLITAVSSADRATVCVCDHVRLVVNVHRCRARESLNVFTCERDPEIQLYPGNIFFF